MEKKYIKLYNEILIKIENNEYKIDTNLPSEIEIMNKTGYSRDTVRKALILLEQNGYIVKAQGKVAKVSKRKKIEFPITNIFSFKELGNKKSVTYIVNLEINKEDKINEILGQAKDEEYFKLVRIREIEGEKIILDKDYISRKYVDNLPLIEATNSIYEYFENKLNLKIDYSEKEIEVKFANSYEKKVLDMKNFDMVVSVKSKTYLEGEKLFQYTESIHRPDKFKFMDRAYRKNKK